MTIILGATATAPNGELYLVPPRAFDSVYAVRVANNSGTVVTVLKNMVSAGQSSQYLLCGQQMVYHVEDVSSRPTAVAVGGGTTNVALLIEWSDDPASDFLGAYPTSFTPTGA